MLELVLLVVLDAQSAQWTVVFQFWENSKMTERKKIVEHNQACKEKLAFEIKVYVFSVFLSPATLPAHFDISYVCVKVE